MRPLIIATALIILAVIVDARLLDDSVYRQRAKLTAFVRTLDKTPAANLAFPNSKEPISGEGVAADLRSRAMWAARNDDPDSAYELLTDALALPNLSAEQKSLLYKDLADVCLIRHDLAESVTNYHEALKNTDPKRSAFRASLLASIGGVYFADHRYQQAEPYFEELLRLREAWQNSTQSNGAALIPVLYDLGECKRRISNAIHNQEKEDLYGKRSAKVELSSAAALLQRAFDLSKQLHGKSAVETSAIAGQLGVAYLELGDYKRALPYLRLRLKTASERVPEARISFLHNCAVCALEIGKENFFLAQRFAENAMTLAEESNNEEEMGSQRLLLSQVYAKQGRYALAEDSLQRGLEQRKKLTPNQRTTYLLWLGLIKLVQEDYEAGGKFVNKAIDVERKHGATPHRTLLALAKYYELTGQSQKAASARSDFARQRVDNLAADRLVQVMLGRCKPK